MNSHINPPENPYAAPQAELHTSASAGPLRFAAPAKYLRQGMVAGGVLGAFFMIFIIVATWNERSAVLTLVMISLATLICCTLVGFLLGFLVQLLAKYFGDVPSDSLLQTLPAPALESPANTSRQEVDKQKLYPPPPLA